MKNSTFLIEELTGNKKRQIKMEALNQPYIRLVENRPDVQVY